jgi:4-hydroxybenzoate polyprenyltransferase
MAWQLTPNRWQDLLGILLCMVTAPASFAMAVKSAGRSKPGCEQPRTAGRHLPARILSAPSVFRLPSTCGVAFAFATLLFARTCSLCIYPAVLLFLGGYSYAKRFTALAHFWLGAALAFSPVAAWIGDSAGEAVSPWTLRLAAGAGPSAGRDSPGWRVRHHLRLPGLRGRHAGQAPQRASRVGVPNALRLAAGCHVATVVPAGGTAAGLSGLRLDLLAGIATVALL